MCQPKPGPRCSNHTMIALRSKRESRLAAQERAQKAEKRFYETKEDPEATTYQENTASFDFERAVEKLREAQEAEQHALKEWYSSPDGQDYLAHKAAEAEDEREAHKWERLLNEAQETRHYQVQAMALVKKTRAGLDSLSTEESQQLQEVHDQGVEVANQIDEVDGEILEKYETLQSKDREAQQARGYVTSTQAEAKRHRDALALVIRDAYLSSGVDSRLANHYTLDSINSMQSGWDYLSDDSSERVPQWSENITIKVKEDDNGASQKAAEFLANDDRYHEALEAVKSKHRDCSAAVPVARAAIMERKEARVALDGVLAKREQLDSQRHQIRRKYDALRAGYGGGTQRQEHYDVNFAQFVRSTYVNTDGTTNAFILSQDLNDKTPLFVPVEGSGRDSNGQFVRTAAGERFYASQLKNSFLRLVKPQEGAVKAFG